jgi:3-hydroxyacyl-CoA dehydrogenase
MTRFENTAVLGFGTMGGGIALVVARSGRNVIVLESEQSRVDAGIAAVTAFPMRVSLAARPQLSSETKRSRGSRARRASPTSLESSW